MKKISFLIFSLASLNLFAQTPVIDKYGESDFGKITGAYYKDLMGFHNQFVGTWLYTSGSTTFKIYFIPKVMQFISIPSTGRNYYTDYLIGEFQYVVNGIEIVNTLSNLNQNQSDIYDYNIVSVAKKSKYSYPRCIECSEDEMRLSMRFNEPSRRNIWGGISNQFVIRRFVQNGQEKLKVQFVYTGNGLEVLDNMDGSPADLSTFSLPYGEYILTKQQ